MKKIFNWTFGGFFRTIGRTLAFLLLGSIFGYIAFKNGIKITDLLGMGRVYASTITSWSSVESRIWYDQQGTNTAGSWSSGSTHTFSPSYPVTSIQWRVKASNGLSNDNTYTFTFGYTPTPDAISVNNVYIRREGDYPNETITCKEWQRNSSTGRYTKECTFTPGYNYSSSDYLFIRIIFNESYITSIQSYISGFNERESTNAVITDQTNNIINNQEQNTQDIINNQNANTQAQIDNQNELLGNKCKNLFDKDNNTMILNSAYINTSTGKIQSATNSTIVYIRCTSNTTYTISKTAGTRFVVGSTNETPILNLILNNYTSNANASSITYRTGSNDTYLVAWVWSGGTDTTITSSEMLSTVQIEEGTQATTYCKYGTTSSKLDALNQSIDNDNVSGANEKAKDLFTNFTTNDHGLTGVISAPLTLIRNLASNTCSSLSLPLPFVNENLTLPCLSAIYQQHFPAILTMYQVIISALIGYKVCISIFFMVKGFKDPGEDKIEVLDL